jgi:hypothetical protein
VPEKGDGLMGDFSDNVVGVVIAIRAGKDENPEFHAFRVTVQVEVDAVELTAAAAIPS